MANVERIQKIETTLRHEITFQDIDALVRKHFKIEDGAEVSYHSDANHEHTPYSDDTVLVYKKTKTEYK